MHLIQYFKKKKPHKKVRSKSARCWATSKETGLGVLMAGRGTQLPSTQKYCLNILTYIQGGWIDLHEWAPSKHNQILWRHDCTHVEKHLSTIKYVSMIYFCISLLRSQRRTLDVVFDVKANEDLTLRSLQHESNVRASCTLTANRLLQQQCKKLWGNEVCDMTSECGESVSKQGTTLQEWMQGIWHVATGQSHAKVPPALFSDSNPPQPSTREYIAFNVKFNSVWQHGCPNRKYALKQCSKKDGNSKIH